MKYLISYFSLTGNTKFLGERIKAGILSSDPESSVDVIPIEKIKGKIDKTYSSYDVIGFGTLSWAWDAAPMMLDHMKSIPSECLKGKKFFFYTSAGSASGASSYNMNDIVVGKGGTGVAEIKILSPGNFIAFMPSTPKDKIKVWPSGYYKPAEEYGAKIPSLVENGKQLSIRYPYYKYITNFVEKTIAPDLKKWTLPIVWNPDTCKGTKCSKCIKGCPVEALVFDENESGIIQLQRDDQKCVGCCRCIHRCPTTSLKRKRDGEDFPKYQFSPKVLVDMPVQGKMGVRTFLTKEEYEKVKVKNIDG